MCMAFSVVLFSQNVERKADDAARIVLNTFVAEQIDGLTPGARNILENKLSQIATLNGMGGTAIDPRFIITANIVVLTKDITPTAPPMHAYTLDVIFYIGDGIDGTLFSSTSLTVKGVGRNETRAYTEAIRNINVRDANFKIFVETGKRRILEYYNSNCDFIIEQAMALAGKKEYEAAIAKLMAVPEVAKDCYSKCMRAVEPLYKQYIDHACRAHLANATHAWHAGLDRNAANNAGNHLAMIDPHSECYDEALQLSDKIGKRVFELDGREWDFVLKQHQDVVDLSYAYIDAAREIGWKYNRYYYRNYNYNIFW